MTPTERELQRLVVDAAKAGGWLWYHTPDSRRCEPGFPDLVLARGGQLMFVEMKAQGGRLTPEQRKWGRELAAAGVTWEVVRGERAAHELAVRLLKRG